MKNAPEPSVGYPFVTCENKRMGALQFDYAGSTLTFPPGRFVTDDAIARSAESRLSPADFQIVHEAPRTAAEAIAENPSLIGRGDGAPPLKKKARERKGSSSEPIVPQAPSSDGAQPPTTPFPDAPPAPLGQGTATSPPDPVVAPPSASAPKKSTAAPKPPKGRAATARKPKPKE